MKVLVVDDEPDIREIITITFNVRWPDAQVIVADTGSRGIELAARENPDVIILDVGLPDTIGFEVCRQLRQITRGPILILTARGTEADKVKGLEAGADDYLTKPFSHHELLARVRAVLRRHHSPLVGAAEPAYERGKLSIDFGTREIKVNVQKVQLLPIEYSLLYHLVKNSGRVIPYKTLLAKVLGREYVDQVDYLSAHVESLRSKLEDDPKRPSLILTERGLGYRFVDPR